ncbi:MAG: hypothetical protein ACYS8Y_11985 [Planctomycetota bacterium]|jgi:CxxC-x17-CxxC domain-containing protein
MKVIKVIKSEKFNELYPAEKTKVLCENCRKEVEAPLHPDTPVWCSPCFQEAVSKAAKLRGF